MLISRKTGLTWAVIALCICLAPGLAAAKSSKSSKSQKSEKSEKSHKHQRGLSKAAFEDLAAADVNKYLGEFTPVSSEIVGDGWVKHSFDAAAGSGPVCITGTDYSVFTRKGQNPRKLLIFLQGGGACWQGLYQCNLYSEAQEPPTPPVGIWDFDNKDNPFRKHSVVYMPYCDGSIFAGDNDVFDPDFSDALAAQNPPVIAEPIRYHRGLRNLSAGMDVAKAVFPKPNQITVAGSSAGGVGTAAFAPFLVRFQYGNRIKKLTVFNDAGPIVGNPAADSAAMARSNDWQFDQFYPSSCTECDPLGQASAIIDWRLANDSSIREAFYETDADGTNIGFTSVNLPGFPPLIPWDPANGVFGLDQVTFRALIVPEHGKLNAKYPKRYKRFIVSGDDSHTALQTPLLYTQEVNGVLLNDWTADFLKNKKGWKDLVEDFQPLP